MTGAQFWSYLQQKIDKAYSAYLDNTKANSLIRESMYRMVDKFWRSQSLERDADEMMPFLIKGQSLTPSLGVIDISAQLPNYMHIMYMVSTYEFPVEVTLVSGTTLTAVNHTLRKGDTIKLGVSTYEVKKVKGDTFDVGVSGLSTGTYYKVFEKSVRQIQSDRKGSSFHKASLTSPMFEPIGDGTTTPKAIKITPSANLMSVEIDYVRIPPLDIDVANNTTTLEDYYSSKFIYRLMDECVLNFGTQTKDVQTRQLAQQDIIENP